jgi:GT2 family glycosyltransferase
VVATQKKNLEKKGRVKFSMIDIIIINYNSTDYLINCLRSIKDSLNGFPADIFVQDNASVDGVDRVLIEFPQIKLTKNSRNIGFAAAVNQALVQGNNQYVMLLNPDTFVLDGFFKESINFMKSHSSTGILGPKVLEKDGKLQNSARSFPTILTAFFGRTSFLSKLFPKNPITLKNLSSLHSDGSAPMEVDWVSGACMLVNRKAIEAVGGLDDRFFLYWEDADWCRRMWESGWKVIYYPKASVCHFTGMSSKKEVLRSVTEFHKSAYRLFEKHERSLVVYLKPLILCGLFIHAGIVLTSTLIRKNLLYFFKSRR